MSRNLVFAGLTAVALCSTAATSRANPRGAGKKPEPTRHGAKAHEPSGGEPSLTPEAAKALTPRAPAAKVRKRTSVSRRITQRAKAAVVNHSLLRPSWTLADLNPMPQLLDLDDTERDLRQATARILELMTR